MRKNKGKQLKFSIEDEDSLVKLRTVWGRLEVVFYPRIMILVSAFLNNTLTLIVSTALAPNGSISYI